MDRPPVTTVSVHVEHRIWPCVPHAAGVDCIVAQEAYLRAKRVFKPARKVINVPVSR